jgi:hypothetical protein
MARRGRRQSNTTEATNVEVDKTPVQEQEGVKVSDIIADDYEPITKEQDIQAFFETQEDTKENLEFEDVLEDVKEEKKDLSAFFEENKNDSLKKDPEKKSKKKKKEKTQKVSKKAKRKEDELKDIKDKKVFKYQNRKYTKVEDFIKFLDDNYLDIDKIAKDVLDRENFYGWLSKNSTNFDESIKTMKKLKDEIENS